MSVTVEIVAAIVGGLVALVAVVVWRKRSGRSSAAKGRVFRGPSEMYFNCARCSARVAHTKRTIAAWEKGSRRIFCDACHKKWRNAQPPQEAPYGASASVASRAGAGATSRAVSNEARASDAQAPAYASESKAPRGCLGVALIIALVPIAIVYFTVNG
jgi:hypothetical protein